MSRKAQKYVRHQGKQERARRVKQPRPAPKKRPVVQEPEPPEAGERTDVSIKGDPPKGESAVQYGMRPDGLFVAPLPGGGLSFAWRMPFGAPDPPIAAPRSAGEAFGAAVVAQNRGEG